MPNTSSTEAATCTGRKAFARRRWGRCIAVGVTEAELLAGCYRKCLAPADERAVRTISFPTIGTGVYGYPQKAAAEIAIREVKRHLERPDTTVEQAIFVLFGKAAYEVYREILGR